MGTATGTVTETLVFNGVDGATGQYLTPKLTAHQLSGLAQGKPLAAPAAPVAAAPADPDELRHLSELKWRHRQATERTFAPIEGVDPKDLAEAGWGVVFAHDADPAIREALAPAARAPPRPGGRDEGGPLPRVRRRRRATAPARRRSSSSPATAPGPARPTPTRCRTTCCSSATPRRSRTASSTSSTSSTPSAGSTSTTRRRSTPSTPAASSRPRPAPPLPRRAAFFGVQNPDDPATQLSADRAGQAAGRAPSPHDKPDWTLQTLLAAEATKARLGGCWAAPRPPPCSSPPATAWASRTATRASCRTRGRCSARTGPARSQWREAIPPDFYFAADDVGADARLLGLIAFYFACYGAGTPRLDDFAHRAFAQPRADRPARLRRRAAAAAARPPQGRRPGGGRPRRARLGLLLPLAGGPAAQLGVFTSTLKRLMEGHPIGSAIEYFNERYAELAADLSGELEEIKFGKVADDYALAEMWTANNDARSYVIIGDPAVRLVVGGDGAAVVERATIGPVTLPRPPERPAAPSATTGSPAAGTAPVPTAPSPTAPALGGAADRLRRGVPAD